MARRLFIIEARFFIKGRGLVPVPGFVPEGEERHRIGDPIRLERPDGSTLDWQIGGIEIFCGTKPSGELHLLLKGLSKDDVPVGTAVWSVDPIPGTHGGQQQE